MGSRRDVVTAVWKTGLEGVWYKCIRCLRQTSAFASPGATSRPNQTGRETWWISRWAYCCPMCGGTWIGHTEAFVKAIILEDDPGFRVAGCKSSSPDLDLSIHL
ncbi:mediator of RNA polymerase II transcription subunit 16 isoform X2 [Prunus yedoensis var. nudiflora]|uniref:Mediator of RNA polymerase II transcription subunit 16 isoform X2 n=1 Tax=Prunus yedoensis var. nudiflora TaxID=2094558 RepID=A0A314URL3_PRUYE|nr:mediator of RNA polymerase II transcription subunit 16 isoform X2 [Prunus yedoensis var. nudiflora]